MHARSWSRRLLVGPAAVGITLALIGCTGASTGAPTTAAGTTPESMAPAPGGSGAASGSVDVTLQEWAVVPATTSVAAGDVTFHVTNEGPEDEHEFVVIRTDLDAGALPTDANGAVDEAGAGIEVVDEVEEIAVGSSGDVTVNLAAGSYALICNIYDETEQEAHYQMGMRIGFDVSG
jgi:uncharacterized cupredoxin-like copper-binding protein